MTYSANSYESPLYGAGFATANNVNGPWTKYEKNLNLQKPRGFIGVGHSAMFSGKNGNLRIVFHAHNSRDKIRLRHMYISDVSFEMRDGEEIMVIDRNYMTPTLNPRNPVFSTEGLPTCLRQAGREKSLLIKG